MFYQRSAYCLQQFWNYSYNTSYRKQLFSWIFLVWILLLLCVCLMPSVTAQTPCNNKNRHLFFCYLYLQHVTPSTLYLLWKFFEIVKWIITNIQPRHHLMIFGKPGSLYSPLWRYPSDPLNGTSLTRSSEFWAFFAIL